MPSLQLFSLDSPASWSEFLSEKFNSRRQVPLPKFPLFHWQFLSSEMIYFRQKSVYNNKKIMTLKHFLNLPFRMARVLYAEASSKTFSSFPELSLLSKIGFCLKFHFWWKSDFFSKDLFRLLGGALVLHLIACSLGKNFSQRFLWRWKIVLQSAFWLSSTLCM